MEEGDEVSTSTLKFVALPNEPISAPTLPCDLKVSLVENRFRKNGPPAYEMPFPLMFYLVFKIAQISKSHCHKDQTENGVCEASIIPSPSNLCSHLMRERPSACRRLNI